MATAPEDDRERRELRSGGILLAASAMGILRGIMGFFTFLVAFAYRGGTDDLNLSARGSALGSRLHEQLLDVDLGGGGTSALVLGVVAGFTVLGSLTGTLSAPRLRRRFSEETVLLWSLVVVAGVSFLGLWSGGLPGALFVGYSVGLGVNGGKLCFDTIVQRDAPDANYGRTFARFETRFQLFWVVGALVPVVFTIPARLGFLVLALAAGFAAFSYMVSSRGTDGEPKVAPPIPQPVTPHDIDPTTVAPAEGDPDQTVVAPTAPVGPEADPTLPLDPGSGTGNGTLF